MQLYSRPFYNILRQQNNFEWTTEHKTQFEEIKKLLTEQISNKIPDPNQPFYAMCDASNFGICATLLQSHNGTNKKNLKSANSRSLTQAELRHSALMSLSYFFLHKKSNPNHRVYRFQLIIMKFPNSHITRTAGKILYYLTLLVEIHH